MFRLLLMAVLLPLLALWPQEVDAYYPADVSSLASPSRLPPYWEAVTPKLIVDAQPSTKVALTFDAGTYPPYEPSILDTLREAGVRCTIFLVGDFVATHPHEVIQMVRDGHEIGNHSDTHPDMPSISREEMAVDLEAMDARIVELTGRSTRPWFRPPSGSYDDAVLEVAAEQGYYTIYWTADTADWRADVDAVTVKQRYLRYAQPGNIMVAHLTSPQTAEVLPEVLRTLREQGIEFGTLSEVLGSLE